MSLPSQDSLKASNAEAGLASYLSNPTRSLEAGHVGSGKHRVRERQGTRGGPSHRTNVEVHEVHGSDSGYRDMAGEAAPEDGDSWPEAEAGRTPGDRW